MEELLQTPSKKKMTAEWKVRIKAKLDKVQGSVPKEWKLPDNIIADLSEPNTFKQAVDLLLTTREQSITQDYTAKELVQKLADSEFSAVEVATAFSKRAEIARTFVNCVTEVNYAAAISRAQELDDHLKSTGKTVGPLHGLPISVKDSFNIEGLQSTIGCVSRLDRPLADSNTPLVQILLNLGAVIHVKTNVPQGIITSDSHNNIFGRTLNPYNPTWTAGGSSGGEAALIALRGSVLGVGTDLAGSIRIPAWCCGVYGIKPTIDRIPYTGIEYGGNDMGKIGVLASAGPLANTLEDCAYFIEMVLSTKPWLEDNTVLSQPWSISDMTCNAATPITVGIVYQDDECDIDEDVRAELKSVAEKLTNAGHKVVHLTPGDYPSFLEVSSSIAFPLLDLDPERQVLKTIMEGNEPIVPSVAKIFAGLYSPSEPSTESGELIMTSVLAGCTSAKEVTAATERQVKYRGLWESVFQKHGLDSLICPCSKEYAPPVDTYTVLPYTNNWNTLDMPALTIPTNRFDLQGYNFGVKPKAIQVVGLRTQDEQLLSAAFTIDRVLNH